LFNWFHSEELTTNCDPALRQADLNWRFKTICTKQKYRTPAINATGKVKLQLPHSRKGKNGVLLMNAQMMSCFYLKIILTHGFMGSTCCFRIRIHCFAFSSTPLQMWVSWFFSSMFCGTRFFCFFFCFLLLLFWEASSGFSMWCLPVPSSGFSCDVFLCHQLDFPCDFLICNILQFLLPWSAAITKAFQFSIFAGVTGPFDSFVLLKGQEGARNRVKLQRTLHHDTECIPSCR
jgi:hypothetical protein